MYVESMKTDTYLWPKETTADPYMKQFIEKKQGTVSIIFLTDVGTII